jgi:hypothetical protein
VNRSADGSDNPYVNVEQDPQHGVEVVRRVIAAGASTVVEFKSTCWNFFVRINNATHDLFGQDALDYQRKRWPASW